MLVGTGTLSRGVARVNSPLTGSQRMVKTDRVTLLTGALLPLYGSDHSRGDLAW
ncbi:hypothetical protein GCM10010452_28850 [Crossiella cryophila]